MPKYDVSLNRDLRVRLYYETEVEADNKDEAWEKAWNEATKLTLEELDIRDCIYSDDRIE